MEQSTGKKIFHICMIIVIIAVILFGVGILILRYQVEGETNLPFEVSKIAVISSVDSQDNADEANRWNLTVNQNNDVYIYIDKNNNYSKTEIIDSIVIDNIVINKAGEKGELHVYKPTEEETSIFKNTEESIVNEITYTGELEADIKQLKISNQGGILAVRFANDNVGTYISNEAEQVEYSKLLQYTNVTIDDLKANVTFDITINLTSGKVYKANISLDIPIEGIVENGTSSKEITELNDIIFKRIENN